MAELIVLTDARAEASVFEPAIVSDDVAVRRAAVLGLARLHDPAAVAMLTAALRDRDAEVRSNASLGLGAMEDAPPEVAEALAAAVEAERDFGVRQEMLRDLGRVAPDAASISSHLTNDTLGACNGLAELGTREIAVPDDALEGIARAMDSDDPAERLACVYAASRIASAHVASLRARMLSGTDDTAEALRFRTLGRYGDATAALSEGVIHARPAAAVYALRALASSEHAAAIEAALARGAQGWESPERQLFVEAIDQALAARHPVDPSLLAQLPADDPAVARLRCLAGDCSTASPAARGEVEARRIAIEKPPDAKERLRALYRGGAPSVRMAALIAWPSVADGDFGLVLDALDSPDGGCVITALGALSAADIDAVSRATLARAVPAILERFARASDLEGLVTALDLAEKQHLTELLQAIEPLTAHENYAVRHSALRVVAAWNGTPRPDHRGPTNVVSRADLGNHLPDVIFETPRGDIRLRLDADAAPVTAHRFVELVERGFYDGTTFHRVVPGFVAQGGDPLGTGYGGPGYSIRCEDNRLPYRRGTVGMALAGRDTGGSQFFITLSAQPHLELRYTAFAEVIEGIEHAEMLLQGDRIIHARVARETGIRP